MRQAVWGLMAPLLFMLVGCTHIPSVADRVASAHSLAAQAGWSAVAVLVPGYELQAFVPPTRPADTRVVFLEGDGFAWVDASTPSLDPTPMRPVALEMALAHPDRDALYLARPCQFLLSTSPDCRQRLWTDARFSGETVEAMNQALDQLKTRLKVRSWVLVGFSGGGAMAALLADRRTDVVGWVTVAGNLDPGAWAQWHRITPLRGSMNPTQVAPRLKGLPQLHAVGARDQEIPPALVRLWPAAFRGPDNEHVWTESQADHVCCWAAAWPRLWARFKQR